MKRFEWFTISNIENFSFDTKLQQKVFIFTHSYYVCWLRIKCGITLSHYTTPLSASKRSRFIESLSGFPAVITAMRNYIATLPLRSLTSASSETLPAIASLYQLKTILVQTTAYFTACIIEYRVLQNWNYASKT